MPSLIPSQLPLINFVSQVKMQARALVLVTAACLVPWAASAQSDDLTDAPANRYPDVGVPVLDCAPEMAALQDTCVLRVPPSQQRGGLGARAVDNEKGEFNFVRPNSSEFPDGVTLSETLVLIDLTPGPQAERRASFDLERDLIRQFVQSLPAGESIAVYGFKEEMVRLSDFSTDRINALAAIDALELTGTNTRLSTFSKEAIGILEERDSAAIKNLFIVSDGDEEGQRDAEGVAQAAIAAKVSVSAIGMFWRPVGAAETGAGMDYLSRMTQDTLGTSVQVQLRRQQDARDTLLEFQRSVAQSFQGSGLIIPDGEALVSDIVLTMRIPTIGVAGAFTEEEIRVRFTPATGDEGADPAGSDAASDGENLLFGYPALWVYGAAALLALVLLILLILIFRSSKSKDEVDLEEDPDFDGFDDVDLTPAAPKPAPKPAQAPALAYLVNTSTRSRLAIRATRVSVGRGKDNAVVIDDDSVSRNHAQISQVSDGGFRLVDLGSLNGTFLNGKKVSDKVVLSSGDQVKFGEVEMNLVLA